MKCPMMFGNGSVFKECLKEECAWYLKRDGNCALKEVVLSLDDLTKNI